jgi:hypothetical protein
MASGNKGQGNCAADEATRTSHEDSHFSLARRSDQPKKRTTAACIIRSVDYCFAVKVGMPVLPSD